MKNNADDIMIRLKALLTDAALQLKALQKQDSPGMPAATDQEFSVRSLQMRNKATQMDNQVFEELILAAYYNANNPDWDPAKPETYWTTLSDDDPLQKLLMAAEADEKADTSSSS